MQNNDGGRPGMNPYMRPMGRSSLLSTPAPLTPVQPVQQYTPNEPEAEAPAFSRPLIFAEAPKADPAWADEPAELDSAAEDAAEQPAEETPLYEQIPMVILPLEDEPAQEDEEPVEPAEEPAAEEEPVYEEKTLLVILPVEEEPEAEDQPAQEDEEPVEPAEEEEPVYEEESPVVILPVEDEPEAEEAAEEPADEPEERMVELPDQLPQEAEDDDDDAAEEPASPFRLWSDPVDYAAAYAMSRVAPELSAEEVAPEVEPQEEILPEEPAPEMAQDMPEEPAAQPEEGQPAYDFDPAYYAAYWQQWQNAMEAHQAATCSACPLLNNQRGKVCYVPVIIPDGTDVDPEAVLTLRSAPRADVPYEKPIAPADVQPELPMEEDIDDGFDDDDEDFTGEDAMASEDMPTPQTVPVGGPDLTPKKKKSRKWPWILLVLVLLLVGGVFTASRMGYLQSIVDWLGLPEGVVQWLRDITLL